MRPTFPSGPRSGAGIRRVMERAPGHALIDVVVPIRGGWDFVEACLESLRRQSVAVNVIVVDDDSPDDSARRVEEAFPEFQLVRSSTNVGFAKACNLGIQAGHAAVIVLVNSDVVASENLVEELLQAFTDEAVGSVTAVLTSLDGRIDAVGVTIDPTLAGFVRYKGAKHWSGTSPRVGCVYGAVAGYRRAALEMVGGGFDGNIFMYGEELELGLRLLAHGWEVKVAERARATHSGGGTVGEGSARQRYLAGFSRGYILRVYGVLGTHLAPRVICVELFATVARLVSSRDFASLHGRIQGWKAARGVPRRARPLIGIEYRIGTAESLRMRSRSYWDKRAPKWLEPDSTPSAGAVDAC